MLRMMPPTVSPGRNLAAFSSQVPSSSLWESVTRALSRHLTTARISIPTIKRSRGCSMRETEMESMGSSETMPQPMSANTPKGSMWVMRAFITSPGERRRTNSSRHFSWAARRESRAVIRPYSSRVKSSTKKHTGRFTRERMAMSRTVPSLMPRAPSSRGMSPRMNFKSTIKLCLESHITALASRIFPSRMASAKEAGVWRAALFSKVSIKWPSG